MVTLVVAVDGMLGLAEFKIARLSTRWVLKARAGLLQLAAGVAEQIAV